MDGVNSDIELKRDYKLFSFLLFVLPSIFTFVFIAVYQIVDGFFIGNFVGPYAIASVNLYYPVISIFLSIGTMIGSGGNAMIVSLLGKNQKEEADKVFSEIIIFIALIGVLSLVLGIIFGKPIMEILGATEGNIDYLKPYYYVLTAFAPAILFQTTLGILIIGEGKTVLTGILVIIGGVLNIVLDYVFMKLLGMGTLGAAIATVIGYLVPVLYALFFYSPRGGSKYQFSFRKIRWNIIGAISYNGSSEMVSNLAAGVTAIFMNHLAYKFYKEVGVSVVSIFQYVQFIVMAVFMGMASAAEPLISYHFGSGNSLMKKKILKLTTIWTMFFSIMCTILVAVFNKEIVDLFFQGQEEASFVQLAIVCVKYSIPACMFVGFNIIVSGIFTALSNGAVSAILSGVRTFVILTICMFALPAVCGADGLWAAWPAAELLSLFVSIAYVIKYRTRYELY